MIVDIWGRIYHLLFKVQTFSIQILGAVTGCLLLYTRVAMYITADNVKAGSVVITENEPADMIYFVADGCVKATDYRVLGIAFDFMKPKNLIAFGGMEVLMKQECYKATIETVTDCIIVKLSRDKYEKWIFSDIEALRKETLITCTYLLEEERRNHLYLFLQGSDRLALMFIHCYEQYNHNGIVCINESRQYEMPKSVINDKVDR